MAGSEKRMRGGAVRRAPVALSAATVLFVATAAWGGPFADFVASFTPGMGAGFGQDQLPGIVLGPPQGGGELQGSLDVLSLGNNGVIVMGFDPPLICDGPGPDLTVFENPFHSGSLTGPIFAEYGIVAVSQDGVNFFTFPYDPVTHVGLAGQNPVLSNPDNGISPLDPTVSGGDQFDLADVGLTWAKYVRITDPGASIDDPGNHLPPGTQAGFDLDAMAALHACDPGATQSPSPTPSATAEMSAAPTPTTTPVLPDPTATPTSTPTLPVSSSTPTVTGTPLHHDAAVATHRPVHMRIRRGQVSATKRLHIKVRNADATGSAPIQLTATTCGPVVTATVDFGRRSDGVPDTALVPAGRTIRATVSLTISAALTTTPDRHLPASCLLTFTATSNVPDNVDPTPGNNSVTVQLIVLDANDFE